MMDPRKKHKYLYRNGDKILVNVGGQILSGVVRRQFLPLAECRNELFGVSLDNSRTETVIPYTHGPNDYKLRYGVSVSGYRMFEVFEDELHTGEA